MSHARHRLSDFDDKNMTDIAWALTTLDVEGESTGPDVGWLSDYLDCVALLMASGRFQVGIFDGPGS